MIDLLIPSWLIIIEVFILKYGSYRDALKFFQKCYFILWRSKSIEMKSVVPAHENWSRPIDNIGYLPQMF